MFKSRHSFWISAVLLTLVFALTGCLVLTGDGGNNSAPIADGGADQMVRSQAEVILSGRNSTDADGVLQSFQWKQVDGPLVVLIKASNSTAKFTVPRIYTATTLEFELTVTDDKSATGTTRVKVFAQPPADADRFLTFLDVPGMFKVVAATSTASSAQAAGQTFSINVETRIDYTVYVDGAPQPRAKTTTQTATGAWPATGSGGENKDDYRNLWYTFNLPTVNLENLRSDLADNERLYGTERNALRVTTNVTLNAGGITSYLYVLDQAGNIINQKAGTPVATLSFASSDGSLNSLFAQQSSPGVAIADAESQRAAAAYNKALDINDKKNTLSTWKTVNGFVDGDPGTVEATYINGFDLGFARRMFMRKDAFGNVYAYVINAPNLEAAASNVNIIAAVAMEYSPADAALPSDTNKFTKFYTFVPNPVTGEMDRVLSMDFDGRGEKYQPGTCATCHGGRAAQPDSNGNYPNSGNIGAHFLPFDVSSFYFSDADFEQRMHKMPPSAAQSEAFRRFNEMVLLTNPTAAVRDLIHGWYGSNTPASNTLPAGTTFNAGFVPAGWRPGTSGGNPAADKAEDASKLYQQVVGPFCRACHTQQSGANFATYDDFMNAKNRITDLVFDRGVMPLARHTMDDFWRSGALTSPAAVLALQLGISPSQTPGQPIARIGRVTVNGTIINSPTASVAVGRLNGTATIRLNADASLFANTQRWQLTVKPLGSNALLVGDTQRDTAFLADRSGTYEVQLIVNNGAADSSLLTQSFVITSLLPHVAADVAATTPGVPVTTSVLANDQMGDAPTRITAVTNGSQGTVTFNASQGTTTYTPGGSASGSDVYTYTITDVDGESSTANVNITITALPLASPDNLSTTANTLKTLTVTANDSLGTAPTTITSVTNGAHGTVTHNATQTTYTPSAYYLGADSYTYTITDANGNTSIGSVSVTVSPNTGTSFTEINNNILRPECSSCHSTGSGLIAFDAVPAQNYSTARSQMDLSNLPGSAANSNLVRKPSDQSPDGGGLRPGFNLIGNHTNYDQVLEWIREGAPNN